MSGNERTLDPSSHTRVGALKERRNLAWATWEGTVLLVLADRLAPSEKGPLMSEDQHTKFLPKVLPAYYACTTTADLYEVE